MNGAGNSIALGFGSNAYKGNSTAIGNGAKSGELGVAIGQDAGKASTGRQGAITVGAQSDTKGLYSVVVGTKSHLTSDDNQKVYTKDVQGAAATVIGSFNDLSTKATEGKAFASVGNTIFGAGNKTEDSNGVIIQGVGNTVTNSYKNIDLSIWDALNIAGGDFSSLTDKETGSIAVIGGANTIDSSHIVSNIGFGNTITGSEGVFVTGQNNTLKNTKDSLIMGNNVSLDGIKGAISLGDKNEISGNNAVLIGHENKVKGNNVVAIGQGTNVNNANSSIALGTGATVDLTNVEESGSVGKWNGIAIGTWHTKVIDSANGIAFGASSSVENSQWGTALGAGSTVKDSDESLSIGHNAKVDGAYKSIAIGHGAKAEGKYAYQSEAFGTMALVKGWDSQAFGTMSSVTEKGFRSTALGSYSVADGQDVISVGHKKGDKDSTGYAYDYDLFRKVTNVADGNITIGSHDAVTGGQLAASGIIGGKTSGAVDDHGNPSSLSIAIGYGSDAGTGYKNTVVGTNASTKGNQFATAIGNSASVYSGGHGSVALGAESAVQESDMNYPPSGATDKSQYDGNRGVVSVGKSGKDGFTRRIINVKAGVNANDAVNKAQLDAVSGDVSGLGETIGTADFSKTNYAQGAENVTHAIYKVDSQVKTNADGVAANKSELDAFHAAGIIAGTTKNDQNPGSYQLAIGKGSEVAAEKGTAIGSYAKVTGGAVESVALGSGSVAGWNDVLDADGKQDPRGVISVGKSGKDGFTRRIVNVKAGVNANDAVNKAQLDAVSGDVSGLGETIGSADFSQTNYAKGSKNVTQAISDVDAQVKTNADSITGLQDKTQHIEHHPGDAIGYDKEYTAVEGNKLYKDGSFESASGKFKVDADGKINDHLTVGDKETTIKYGSAGLTDKANLTVSEATGITATYADSGKAMVNNSVAVDENGITLTAEDKAYATTNAFKLDKTGATFTADDKTTTKIIGNKVTTGSVTGLTNTTWNAAKVQVDRAATEGQLQSVKADIDANSYKGWKVSVNGGEAAAVASNATVDFANTDDNVSLSQDGTKIKVDLKDDVAIKKSLSAADGKFKVDEKGNVLANNGTSALQVNDKVASLAYGTNTIIASDTGVELNGAGNHMALSYDGAKFWDNQKNSTTIKGNTITTGSITAGDIKINNAGKITGIANGDISETSTDAVNGSQLHEVRTLAGKHTSLTLKDEEKNLELKHTEKDDQNDYVLSLKKDLIVDSITAGTNVFNAAGLTIGTLKLTNGSISGLNNTKFYVTKYDSYKGSSNAATEGQLHDAFSFLDSKIDNISIKGDGNVVVDPNGKGNTGSGTTEGGTTPEGGTTTKPAGSPSWNIGLNNEKITLGGDKNNVTIEGTIGNITATGTVKAGDTSISSNGVQVGDEKTGSSLKAESLTVGGKEYIGTNGINANNQAVTNVADGAVKEDSKDAVNGGQLWSEQQARIDADNAISTQLGSLGTTVNKLDRRVDQVGAGAAALAALHPLDYDPLNKWDFAAGYGNYRGASAVAIGTYYRPNENTMLSVGGSFGSGENMVNAGVSFKFGDGRHDSVGTSRAAMAKTIDDLKADNKSLADTVATQGKQLKEQTDKMAAQDKKLADYDQKMKEMEAKLEQLLKAQKQ